MLLLFALILRGVVFEFRDKIDSAAWRRTWDACLAVGSFLPALLLGVAFANIFMGLPLENGIFRGNLLTLLNPYGLVGGLTFVAVFCVHGAIWLCTRATGELRDRTVAYAKKLWLAEAALAVIFLALTLVYTKLWHNVVIERPYWLVLPALAVLGLAGQRLFLAGGRHWRAWFSSSALILGVTLFGVAGLFPDLMPSSIEPVRNSVTAFNSASSHLTLKIMLGVVACFLPIVIAYQTWVYFKFRDPITPEGLDRGPSY
jgi:cytochrome d ubiquinol oxidase subunit II